MNGLSWTQREITHIYARAGFVALSPDFMEGVLPNGRVQALHAKNSLDVYRAVQQIAAAADFLRSLPWVGSQGAIGVMGFCLGGGLALLAAAKTDRFQAGIIYHQSLFPDPRELQSITCKLQCHYGTEDESSPRAEVDAFTEALDRYGVSYELHWYEGMGHSFAQITPDAAVPPARRAATELSQDRCFEFLRTELAASQSSRPAAQMSRVPEDKDAAVPMIPEPLPVETQQGQA
jgi:dienelactone hydrolase